MPEYCIYKYDVATGEIHLVANCSSGYCHQINATGNTSSSQPIPGTPCAAQWPTTPRRFQIHFKPPTMGNPDHKVLYFYERKREDAICYHGQIIEKFMNASGGIDYNLDALASGGSIIFESRITSLDSRVDGSTSDQPQAFDPDWLIRFENSLQPFVEIKIRCDMTASPSSSSYPDQKPSNV